MRPTTSSWPQDMEEIAGPVERVTFHGAESGFCVLRVKARGPRDLVTVVGQAATIAAGEWVTASGGWSNDGTHGLQFRPRLLATSEPTSREGIEKYLGSGMIRGIGPVYARRLVEIFGADVFDVIEVSPERLHEVGGIGPRRAARFTAAWADQMVIREIMVFLHEHGVGTARAVRIFKTYGSVPRPAIDDDTALPWIEGRTGLALAPSEVEAVRLAPRAKGLVIAGGPGVGTTMLVNAILRILGAKGVRRLCAPTGRAARRMAEAPGARGHHHPPAPPERPRHLRFQARRGEPARLRPPGARRELDDRHAARARAPQGGPR